MMEAAYNMIRIDSFEKNEKQVKNHPIDAAKIKIKIRRQINPIIRSTSFSISINPTLDPRNRLIAYNIRTQIANSQKRKNEEKMG